MCLAVPGKITKKFEDQTAIVELAGVEREVSLELVPGAKVSDYVLVHAGFAIQMIDEAEAQKTLELFEEMMALEDAYNSEQGSLHH